MLIPTAHGVGLTLSIYGTVQNRHESPSKSAMCERSFRVPLHFILLICHVISYLFMLCIIIHCTCIVFLKWKINELNWTLQISFCRVPIYYTWVEYDACQRTLVPWQGSEPRTLWSTIRGLIHHIYHVRTGDRAFLKGARPWNYNFVAG